MYVLHPVDLYTNYQKKKKKLSKIDAPYKQPLVAFSICSERYVYEVDRLDIYIWEKAVLCWC